MKAVLFTPKHGEVLPESWPPFRETEEQRTNWSQRAIYSLSFEGLPKELRGRGKEVQMRAKLLKWVFHFLKRLFSWRVWMPRQGADKTILALRALTFTLADMCLLQGWGYSAAQSPWGCLHKHRKFSSFPRFQLDPQKQSISLNDPLSPWDRIFAYFIF